MLPGERWIGEGVVSVIIIPVVVVLVVIVVVVVGIVSVVTIGIKRLSCCVVILITCLICRV